MTDAELFAELFGAACGTNPNGSESIGDRVYGLGLTRSGEGLTEAGQIMLNALLRERVLAAKVAALILAAYLVLAEPAPIQGPGLRCRSIELSAEQREALTMPKGWAR